jgi:hypothetical protein
LGPKKKPKINTSMGSEPNAGVLVVSMVSARIQLTFTASSCDHCRDANLECMGRTRSTSCYECQSSKKACIVNGTRLRAARSTKQVANSVIPVEEESDETVAEESNVTVAEGQQVIALARQSLELAKKVRGLEMLIKGLYDAAIGERDLLPVLSEYRMTGQQDNLETAQQTDYEEPVN